MTVAHVAGRLEVAGLDAVEEFAQMPRRIRDGRRWTWEIFHLSPFTQISWVP